MHEHVFQILGVRLLVVFSAKTGEPLIAKVSLDRVKPLNQNVEPEIEFLFVDQQWCLDIPLNEQVRMVV